jgi:hypothetical protein
MRPVIYYGEPELSMDVLFMLLANGFNPMADASALVIFLNYFCNKGLFATFYFNASYLKTSDLVLLAPPVDCFNARFLVVSID